MLAAIRESEGTILTVSEDEIVQGLAELARRGLFVEPTTGVVGAALSRLIAEGAIGTGDTVAAVLTGTGLKAVEKIGTALGLDSV